MDDAYAILQAGQRRMLTVVGKDCCDCSIHVASGNDNFAPGTRRWSGGGQADGRDAYSASLEAIIWLSFNRAAVTAGSNCAQPVMDRIVRYMPDAVCTIANVVSKNDCSRFGVDISRSAMPLPAHKNTAGFGTEAKRGLNAKRVALLTANETDMPS
jgi:hypothetical protein